MCPPRQERAAPRRPGAADMFGERALPMTAWIHALPLGRAMAAGSSVARGEATTGRAALWPWRGLSER